MLLVSNNTTNTTTYNYNNIHYYTMLLISNNTNTTASNYNNINYSIENEDKIYSLIEIMY